MLWPSSLKTECGADVSHHVNLRIPRKPSNGEAMSQKWAGASYEEQKKRMIMRRKSLKNDVSDLPALIKLTNQNPS